MCVCMYVNMHNVCAHIQYSENNPDTVSVCNTLLHTRKHALFQTWERKGNFHHVNPVIHFLLWVSSFCELFGTHLKMGCRVRDWLLLNCITATLWHLSLRFLHKNSCPYYIPGYFFFFFHVNPLLLHNCSRWFPYQDNWTK